MSVAVAAGVGEAGVEGEGAVEAGGVGVDEELGGVEPEAVGGVPGAVGAEAVAGAGGEGAGAVKVWPGPGVEGDAVGLALAVEEAEPDALGGGGPDGEGGHGSGCEANGLAENADAQPMHNAMHNPCTGNRTFAGDVLLRVRGRATARRCACLPSGRRIATVGARGVVEPLPASACARDRRAGATAQAGAGRAPAASRLPGQVMTSGSARPVSARMEATSSAAWMRSARASAVARASFFGLSS